MAISAAEVYLLNKMNSVAAKVQLGTLIQNAETVTADEVALAYGSIFVGNSSGVAAALACTGGQLLLGNSSNRAAFQSVTGDVTISNAGVTAIGNAKVLKAMLATGIVPSHVVKYAGSFTTAGGDAAEQIAVPGVVGTDIAIVVLHTKGGTPRTLLTAQAGTDVIDLEFSGDPSTDHVVKYMVLRATT